MSTNELLEDFKKFEPEVTSRRRYTFWEMIPYSIWVRAVAPPMFSGVCLIISDYRWTSIMKRILHDKKVPYGMWVEIAMQFLMRHAS